MTSDLISLQQSAVLLFHHHVNKFPPNVVGTADPRDFAQKRLQARHKVPDENTFNGMSIFLLQ